MYYKEHVEKIYNYLFYRTGRNKSVAEDLTQEVFLKALEKIDRFDPDFSSFNSWIYAIARNHLIDHYRVQKVETSLEKVKEFLHSDYSIPKAFAAKQEVLIQLSRLEEIPAAYQDIITLKYINEFSNDEIAKILEKEPGTVRVLLHRALAALKKLYNE